MVFVARLRVSGEGESAVMEPVFAARFWISGEGELLLGYLKSLGRVPRDRC